jgi:hypothetical protein
MPAPITVHDVPRRASAQPPALQVQVAYQFVEDVPSRFTVAALVQPGQKVSIVSSITGNTLAHGVVEAFQHGTASIHVTARASRCPGPRSSALQVGGRQR